MASGASRLVASAVCALCSAGVINVLMLQDQPGDRPGSAERGPQVSGPKALASEPPAEDRAAPPVVGSLADGPRTGALLVPPKLPEPSDADDASEKAASEPGAREKVLADRTTRGAPPRGLVRAVQRELADRGYDPGPVDGIAGVMTEAAVLAFQFDHKLPLTATPSAQLLKFIVFNGQANERRLVARGKQSARASELVTWVQEGLAKLGYEPGSIDGVPGAGTRRAIARFEKDRGLTETGRVSSALLKELAKATGDRLAASR